MLTPTLLFLSLLQADPVKIAIDVSQVPELKEWAEKAKVLCIVKELNAAGRSGKYKDELFKEATGKDLDTLWKDYLAAP